MTRLHGYQVYEKEDENREEKRKGEREKLEKHTERQKLEKTNGGMYQRERQGRMEGICKHHR